MPTPRTIAVVTGTRAEFGLLRTVMRAIAAHPALRLITIVTGMHLTRGTWLDVAASGFRIDARVPMQKPGVTGRAADAAALGRGIIGLGRAFEAIKPDFALVLGDRIEAFAAASAASIGGMRVAHLHGGDRAEGVADEAMRHAISKLSHVHFAATVRSRNRLIRMGEPAAWVFNVGSPAIDELRDVVPADGAPDVIIMQHPVGGDDASEHRWMKATLQAVRRFTSPPPAMLILAPNSDPGSDGIRAAIAASKLPAAEHLPRERFLAMLKGSAAIVGNSSAGLIEAAAMGVCCVNIGPRQNGREKPGNVVDCGYGQKNVLGALVRVLGRRVPRFKHPYGEGATGAAIAARLAMPRLDQVPLRKRNAY